MAADITTADMIDDAITVFVAEARYTMEHPGAMAELVDNQTLPMKMGRTYREPWFGSLNAHGLVPGIEFNSATPIQDYALTITPGEVGIQVLWEHRMADSITENFPKVAGQLMGNAVGYRKDTDLLSLLDGFGGSLGSGTAPLTAGIISAALTMVRSGLPATGAVPRAGSRDTGDPMGGPYAVVAHEFNRHDLFGQLVGVGGSGQLSGAVAANWPMQAGMTDSQRRWLEENYAGNIAGGRVVFTGNLRIVANQVKGGAIAKNGLINLKYRQMIDKRVETDDGRFTKHTMVVDYGFGERNDTAGMELFLDATQPVA